MIYTDSSGHFFKEIWDGVKIYRGKTSSSCSCWNIINMDNAIGLGNLVYNISETGVAEVWLISNKVGKEKVYEYSSIRRKIFNK